MIARKIGKLIRGNVAPFHIYSACILGALIGFLPGFGEAPGLYLAFLSLLVVLNANLFLAGVTLLVSGLLALVLLPVSFHTGRMLLDGPATGLFQTLINAPVFAWFGFENYVATGGLLLGLIFGGGAGYGMVRFVRTIRRALAQWESRPESFEKWTGKWYIKLPAWLLIGGIKGKASYAELAEMRKGKPFRTIGLALVAVTVAFLAVLTLFFQDYILTAQLRGGLERLNGATVDIDSTELNLPAGVFRIHGLAMADPEALDTNVFQAGSIILDISTASLLRKKFELDSVVVEEGRSGSERRIPGSLVGPAPRPAPPEPDVTGLEDYLAAAAMWKRRLSTARQWIERISPPTPADEADPDPERVTLAERLHQRADALGYSSVRADHLVTGKPRVTVRQFRAGGVELAQLPGRLLDVEGRHLSTQPALLEEASEISVRSRDEAISLDLIMGTSAREPSGNRIDFRLTGMDWDAIRSELIAAEDFPLQGGRFDLELIGSFEPAALQLPLHARFHQTTVVLPGAGTTQVDRLEVPIELTGPMDNPRVRVPPDALRDALAGAGQQRLLDEARGLLGGDDDSESEDLRDRAGSLLERMRSGDR